MRDRIKDIFVPFYISFCILVLVGTIFYKKQKNAIQQEPAPEKIHRIVYKQDPNSEKKISVIINSITERVEELEQFLGRDDIKIIRKDQLPSDTELLPIPKERERTPDDSYLLPLLPLDDNAEKSGVKAPEKKKWLRFSRP